MNPFAGNSPDEVAETSIEMVARDVQSLLLQRREQLGAAEPILGRMIEKCPIRPAVQGLASNLFEE